jgi:hypothetical protein
MTWHGRIAHQILLDKQQTTIMLSITHILMHQLTYITRERFSQSQSLMLRPTISRPVCLEINHPSGAYDKIIVWQLRVCWFGAPSLTRGRVCRLPLLLAFASAVIFGSESRRTRGHILLSQIRYFPFRRLLRFAGSRWRYSTPPPHGFGIFLTSFQFINPISRADCAQTTAYVTRRLMR